MATDGGAIATRDYSSLTLQGCQFLYNKASGTGGAIYATLAPRLTLDSCTLHGNSSSGTGGAIRAEQCTPQFSDCLVEQNTGSAIVYLVMSDARVTDSTFQANTGDVFNVWDGSVSLDRTVVYANHGMGINGGGGSDSELRSSTIAYNTGAGVSSSYPPVTCTRTIIAFNGGAAISCGTMNATPSCCDFFGNAGGDWATCLTGQGGVNGNFSSDPLFCDPAAGIFTLMADSPCAAQNNPDCGGIGALGVGCPASWVADIQAGTETGVIVVPNPSRGEVSISYSSTAGTPAIVTIHDVTGRQVRTLSEALSPSGAHSVLWDGKDDGGRDLPAGVYLARVNTIGGTFTGRVVLAR